MNPWCSAEWNPLVGCSPVNRGCRQCFAAKRIYLDKPEHASVTLRNGIPTFTGRVYSDRRNVDAPLTIHAPQTWFVCSESDLFHEAVPRNRVREVLDIIKATPHHTYNLLTKRPDRGRWELKEAGLIPNLRYGFSCHNQASFDDGWKYLRDTIAGAHIVSIQPMLGPVRINEPVNGWVVAMQEMGVNPTPMRAEWVRELRADCDALSTPFFFEMTSMDSQELVQERIRARDTGRPYHTQCGNRVKVDKQIGELMSLPIYDQSREKRPAKSRLTRLADWIESMA